MEYMMHESSIWLYASTLKNLSSVLQEGAQKPVKFGF